MPIQPQMTPELVFEELVKFACHKAVTANLFKLGQQSIGFYQDLLAQTEIALVYSFSTLREDLLVFDSLLPDRASDTYREFLKLLEDISATGQYTQTARLNQLYRELVQQLQPVDRKKVNDNLGETVRRLRLFETIKDLQIAVSETINRFDRELPRMSIDLQLKPEDLSYSLFAAVTGRFSKVYDMSDGSRISLAQRYVNMMPIIYNITVQLMEQDIAIRNLWPEAAKENGKIAIMQLKETANYLSLIGDELMRSDFLPKLRALREPIYFGEARPSTSEAYNSVSRAMFNEEGKLIPVFRELSVICDTVLPNTLDSYIKRISTNADPLLYEIAAFQENLRTSNPTLYANISPLVDRVIDAITTYSLLDRKPDMQDLVALRSAMLQDTKALKSECSEVGVPDIASSITRLMSIIAVDANDAITLTNAQLAMNDSRAALSQWMTQHEGSVVSARYASFGGFGAKVPGTDRTLMDIAMNTTYELRMACMYLRSSDRPIDNAMHISNVAQEISLRLEKAGVPQKLISLDIHTRASAYIPNPPDFP